MARNIYYHTMFGHMARNIYFPTMFGHISSEITKHLQN
jgi:hypothetical protein